MSPGRLFPFACHHVARWLERQSARRCISDQHCVIRFLEKCYGTVQKSRMRAQTRGPGYWTMVLAIDVLEHSGQVR